MLATPQITQATPANVGYLPLVDAPCVDAADDTLMSKEDFFAEVDAALEEVRQGKGRVFNSKEELRAYFDSL
jgi:hypothetical protein